MRYWEKFLSFCTPNCAITHAYIILNIRWAGSIRWTGSSSGTGRREKINLYFYFHTSLWSISLNFYFNNITF